jgi:hypothetical protein
LGNVWRGEERESRDALDIMKRAGSALMRNKICTKILRMIRMNGRGHCRRSK